MKKELMMFGFVTLLILLMASGCATKKQMNKGFENVDKNMQSMEGSIESNQTRINENERYIKDHEGRIIALSDQTAQALNKIENVEKIAMGKLLYQVTLDNDDVKFKSGKAELEDSGMAAIDELVDRLIRENRNVFIEIQGHTDSAGEEEYNLMLGEKRAEAVRRYLSSRGIPLHRMSIISYGETKPIADNSTVEGRKMNRRVVLLVLE